jgi:hypothetical protein
MAAVVVADSTAEAEAATANSLQSQSSKSTGIGSQQQPVPAFVNLVVPKHRPHLLSTQRRHRVDIRCTPRWNKSRNRSRRQQHHHSNQ